ncbi:tRNA guanosine(34) transglycosylase Tgt [Fodinibius halophilus]|uniref:Queuine tRNA-ribosyltransferase n=1 Tax=Fodinibius halophilus TaxID=1736908 RepID=A0A6M1TMM6_9BACT|nr:tRNA guanosine(34) transglycosylase Tgt [Fodinibius halophilus]NGP89640.1 tRNA guanosine(34) transglycosylase Tgt [Fodinibius halophilus]
MFELKKTAASTKARLGTLTTDHGEISTPIFMPVGTLASVKAVKQDDLKEKIKAQIILGNTYHLYLRPGCDIMESAGGLHSFMSWDRPILTDSGGYQVFSLSDNRELTEEGAEFKSHLDGSKHMFTPENVVDIQRTLGSDIMMVLDECPPYPCSYEYAKESMELTHRWEKRGREAFLNTEPKYGHKQAQFGIVQGGTFEDLRIESSKRVADMDFEGIAIGGLSVGEPTDLMYEMTDLNTDYLPENKARYLMGVGKPANLLHCIARGIDMFDCVLPTRNARNGQIFTDNGYINISNAKWKNHNQPLDPAFPSDLCSKYKMSYIHHLFRNNELLGLELASLHNLTFYLSLMDEVKERIANDTFHNWYKEKAEVLDTKI